MAAGHQGVYLVAAGNPARGFIDKRDHLGAIEGSQIHVNRVAAAVKLRQHSAQRVAVGDLIGAEGEDGQESSPVQRAHQAADQHQRGRIGPLDVLNDQNESSSGADVSQEEFHGFGEQPDRARCDRGPRRARIPQQGGDGCPAEPGGLDEGLVAQCLGQRVQNPPDGGEWDTGRSEVNAVGFDDEDVLAKARTEFGHQTTTSDARLPADNDCPWGTRRSLFEALSQKAQLNFSAQHPHGHMGRAHALIVPPPHPPATVPGSQERLSKVTTLRASQGRVRCETVHRPYSTSPLFCEALPHRQRMRQKGLLGGGLGGFPSSDAPQDLAVAADPLHPLLVEGLCGVHVVHLGPDARNDR